MWGEVHPDPVRTAGLQGEVCGLPLLHPLASAHLQKGFEGWNR